MIVPRKRCFLASLSHQHHVTSLAFGLARPHPRRSLLEYFTSIVLDASPRIFVSCITKIGPRATVRLGCALCDVAGHAASC